MILRSKAAGLWLLAIWLLAGGLYSPGLQSAEMEWQSAHAGLHWQAGVTSISFAPADARQLWISAYEAGGIYQSSDGGRSWDRRAAGIESVVPLCVLPLSEGPLGETVLAGAHTGLYITGPDSRWRAADDVPVASVYFLLELPDRQGILAGVESAPPYLSLDAGRSWGPASTPFETALAAHADGHGSIYIGTAEDGLWWWNPEGGDIWRIPLPHDASHVPAIAEWADTLLIIADGRVLRRAEPEAGWVDVTPPGAFGLSLLVDPRVDDVTYLGAQGLWKSVDAGQTWNRESAFPGVDVISLAADPLSRQGLFAGTQRNGLFVSHDAGKSWIEANSEVGRRPISSLAQDLFQPERLYAGGVDGVYRSDDRGTTWERVSEGAGRFFVHGLAIDPFGREWVMAGAHDGIYLSRDAGESWVVATRDLGAMSVFPILFHPHDPLSIFAGAWGINVLASRDAGQSWESLHGGLETLSVYALAIDPHDSGVMYAGTVEAVYGSQDGGASWVRLGAVERPITFFSLAIDPLNPRRLYAGATDGVYLSPDGGASWHKVVNGLGEVTVNVVRVHPSVPAILFVGTEGRGVYVSMDAGENWRPAGLSELSVYDLLIDGSDDTLWAATEDGVYRTGLRIR